MPMGVLAPRSLHTRLSALPPINISGVIFKHLPQPPRSHIRSFGTLGLTKCEVNANSEILLLKA